MPVIVGRPINGIAVNGLEYVVDEKGELVVFADKFIAKVYLMESGIKKDDLGDFVYEEHEVK